MIPFLHIGPLTIPTFGLMVATALLVSGYILQADLNRRASLSTQKPKPGKSAEPSSHQDDGFLMVTIAGIAGLLGARLYHVLETPREFFANPWPMLFTRYGFAWFGGFLGGFLALIILARHFKTPVLEFFDICAPAAAVGYAIGRIGCLLSGDGDYGRPTLLPWGMAFPNGVVPTTDTCVQEGWPESCRVHPTPIYEFFIWLAIAAFLWYLGGKALRSNKLGATRGDKLSGQLNGVIFCGYLILTGVARFLVEFLRINPRSFYGLTNAQAASIVSVAAGAALLWHLKTTHRQAPASAAANP
ncbi:MAG: prolipoprotein diacylglyceryl transferase [Candidatus Acidiferrum sp.]|jgi:phosphatidylglycerol:prolipoprotein diacylglycerol transferase